MLKEMCRINGVSGREKEIREYIIEQLPADAAYRVDALGNLIVEKKGAARPKNRVMLAAHMDEVGFIVTYITEDGYLKFSTVGGIDERVIFGRAVTVGRHEVPGVIGAKALHQCRDEELKKVPEVADMFIDIGASSREEAETAVSVGDMVTFRSECIEFGDGFIKGKAIDDRAGCLVLLHILEKALPYDATFVFTVQEEIGTRGAAAAAFSVAPDYAIVIESTTAADLPDVPDHRKVCRLGEGVAVSFMDRSTIYAPELYERAFALAKENHIPCQPKTVVAGGNDAGAIHKARGGARVLTLSSPCRYIHSPSCVIKQSDLKSAEDLAFVLLRDFCNAEKN